MKSQKTTKIIFLLIGLFFLSAGTSLSQAQEKKDSSTTSSSTSSQPMQKSKLDLEKARKNARVLLDKIDVIGTLAKPQAIFIIPGSDPKVDGIVVDRSFFVEIFRPVEKDFFPQKGRRKYRGAIPW